MKGIAIYNDEEFIKIKEDEELFAENISRILKTYPGQRVGNPLFGSNLENFLFEREVVLLEDIEFEIISKVNKFEPRVNVASVDVKIDKDNRMANIYIIVVVKENLETLNLNLNLVF